MTVWRTLHAGTLLSKMERRALDAHHTAANLGNMPLGMQQQQHVAASTSLCGGVRRENLVFLCSVASDMVLADAEVGKGRGEHLAYGRRGERRRGDGRGRWRGRRGVGRGRNGAGMGGVDLLESRSRRELAWSTTQLWSLLVPASGTCREHRTLFGCGFYGPAPLPGEDVGIGGGRRVGGVRLYVSVFT